MIVGFTGTRRLLSTAQKHALRMHITAEHRLDPITDWHHGDCVGADEFTHNTIINIAPYINLHVHPPTKNVNRAFCTIRTNQDTIYQPKGYHERNNDIVAMCDMLIGAPNTLYYNSHSGTWYTIKLAKDTGKPFIIIYPNGQEEYGNQ